MEGPTHEGVDLPWKQLGCLRSIPSWFLHPRSPLHLDRQSAFHQDACVNPGSVDQASVSRELLQEGPTSTDRGFATKGSRRRMTDYFSARSSARRSRIGALRPGSCSQSDDRPFHRTIERSTSRIGALRPGSCDRSGDPQPEGCGSRLQQFAEWFDGPTVSDRSTDVDRPGRKTPEWTCTQHIEPRPEF